MKLTTGTHLSLDGVMQGLGGADERGGWAIPLFDNEAYAFLLEVFGRLDASCSAGTLIRWLLEKDLVDEINLFTYPVVVGQGTRLFPDTGPDRAVELVESQTTPGGVIIQVYRPAGRPEYAT